jgi:hypothetical protein
MMAKKLGDTILSVQPSFVSGLVAPTNFILSGQMPPSIYGMNVPNLVAFYGGEVLGVGVATIVGVGSY